MINVRDIPGIGEVTEAALGRLGIRTVADLLRWYPRLYLDASNPLPINRLERERLCAIKVVIQECHHRRSSGRGVMMVEATGEDVTGKITLRWFNQPYLERRLLPGSEWVLIGTPERFRNEWTMMSPLIETEPRILSIYAQTKGVTSKMLRGYVDYVLRRDPPADNLPAEIRNAEGLWDEATVLRTIHQPQTMAEVEIARHQIGFEEAFWFFMAMIAGKQKMESETGIRIASDVPYVQELVAALPFELTPGQKRVAWDIIQDIERGQPMTRLLNGDVGSGKTVVAGLVAAMVAKAGYQSIILVPTEILAKQHTASLQSLFGERLQVRQWTAAHKESLDEADLIVGTHAVLQGSFTIPRLAFVVIDEQHRFGVRQRQFLRDTQERPPHVLSMTATPIPRTLALTLYGNMSVSMLKDKPKDRLPVWTGIVRPKQRDVLQERIMQELAAGNQVFVVCPLIEEKEKVSADGEPVLQLFETAERENAEKKTVLAETEILRKEHPEYGVIEPVHGKMKADQKREIMERMARGEINVLVATSVIEVGVDIPRATVMVIEGAEHFGLAQLHQFRGRVGRSERPSYCFLCPNIMSDTVMARLDVLVRTQSGFEIAEADLELRGPGELVGQAQSGLPDFHMASLTDLDFLGHVRQVATDYVEKHPEYLLQYAASPYSGIAVMTD